MNARPELTEKELEVLKLMRLGKDNTVIAQLLKASPSTIGTHVSHIFEKMGCNDRVTCVVEAMSWEILPMPPRHQPSAVSDSQVLDRVRQRRSHVVVNNRGPYRRSKTVS
jgi:DNA-binding CsgD family transcriptional regulator